MCAEPFNFSFFIAALLSRCKYFDVRSIVLGEHGTSETNTEKLFVSKRKGKMNAYYASRRLITSLQLCMYSLSDTMGLATFNPTFYYDDIVDDILVDIDLMLVRTINKQMTSTSRHNLVKERHWVKRALQELIESGEVSEKCLERLRQ